MIELVDVYTDRASHGVLYELLSERRPHENISHKKMPTWEEHCAFVDRRPYQYWYLLKQGIQYAGAIYLTARLHEIGVWTFEPYGQAIAERAVKELMRLHPRNRFVVNVNPCNQERIAMFAGIGFRHIQNTYEMIP